MLLYNTNKGIVVKYEKKCYQLPNVSWDYWLRLENLQERLLDYIELRGRETTTPTSEDLLPPISKQEVWAAGVTYFKSRTARMEESSDAGGSNFYDHVYNADRPELFMKATAHRVVGHGQQMRLRSDSKWMVPEPELTLMISSSGDIVGYTVGNDLSCRDIEGENPLYLPQAKTFDACAAIGPAVFISDDPLPNNTKIKLVIKRGEKNVFEGSTDLSQMKKKPDQLVKYLFSESSFPEGCYLMTGTGIVPPDDFTLKSNDEMRITIDPIGTLVNTVA